MKINFKRFLVFIFLIICAVLISITSYVSAFSNDVKNSVLRLHIIANSDSNVDQSLKLKVRNKILEEMKKNNFSSKEDAVKYCSENLDKFKKIAENVVLENGFSYPISVELGSFYFPTKNYSNVSLPAGDYDALRIIIGNGSGHNWWCVMFPPLCFEGDSSGIISDESKNILENELSEEELSLITSEEPEYKVKFKIIEIFNNLMNNEK